MKKTIIAAMMIALAGCGGQKMETTISPDGNVIINRIGNALVQSFKAKNGEDMIAGVKIFDAKSKTELSLLCDERALYATLRATKESGVEFINDDSTYPVSYSFDGGEVKAAKNAPYNGTFASQRLNIKVPFDWLKGKKSLKARAYKMGESYHDMEFDLTSYNELMKQIPTEYCASAFYFK